MAHISTVLAVAQQDDIWEWSCGLEQHGATLVVQPDVYKARGYLQEQNQAVSILINGADPDRLTEKVALAWWIIGNRWSRRRAVFLLGSDDNLGLDSHGLFFLRFANQPTELLLAYLVGEVNPDDVWSEMVSLT